MPIGWMWSLARELIGTAYAATRESELRISVRGSVYTLRRIKNDRCELSRLSKIAHLLRANIALVPPTGSNQRRFIWPDMVRPDMVRRKRHMGAIGNARPYGVHQRPGILKFLPTLQADLVRPFLDREHTTALAVMAAEGKAGRWNRAGSQILRSLPALATSIGIQPL